ncbi:MAG: hypothetical protein DSY90_00310, partial [Deltaproteobacteria bacterium]
KDVAVMRWHLADANWRLDGMTLSCSNMSIEVLSDCETGISLVQLPESRYYMEQHLMPVMEIKCLNAGKIRTVICFKA